MRRTARRWRGGRGRRDQTIRRRSQRMIRALRVIAVTLCAALAVALIIGSFIRRGPIVLLHRKSAAGRHTFIVADNGRLLIGQQQLLSSPPNGPTVDLDKLGQINIAQNFNIPGVRGSVSGYLTMDPVTPNIRHGFIWLDANPMWMPAPGTGNMAPAAPGNTTSNMALLLRVAGAPMWMIALILGIAPALASGMWLRRNTRRARRLRRGQCIGCGYDLRATADRCPECGRAVEPPAL